MAQLTVTLRFWRLLRRAVSASSPLFAPPVSVLVACKGDLDDLEENALALTRQDYAGEFEFLFVVPAESDPAFQRLGPALKGQPHARVLISGAQPARCSGKNADLLYALERVSPQAEILAFADADVRVRPTWLRDLVAPLSDPEACASTAAMLYMPKNSGLWSFLRVVWMGAGIPYFELMGCVTGQSSAIRRRDFEALNMREIWARSFMDDLSLARELRRAGKCVRYAASAMPFSRESCDRSQFLSQFNRWMTAFRVYDKRTWGLGLLVTALKAWLLVLGLRRPELLALLFGMDAANLLLLFLVYQAYLGDRIPLGRAVPWLAACCAPLLQAAYLLNFLSSLWPRPLAWGGRLYRVRGPQDIQVLP